MKELQISGYRFATMEPIHIEIVIDLTNSPDNTDFSIRHNDAFTIVHAYESDYYMETNSLVYDLLK